LLQFFIRYFIVLIYLFKSINVYALQIHFELNNHFFLICINVFKYWKFKFFLHNFSVNKLILYMHACTHKCSLARSLARLFVRTHARSYVENRARNIRLARVDLFVLSRNYSLRHKFSWSIWKEFFLDKKSCSRAEVEDNELFLAN